MDEYEYKVIVTFGEDDSEYTFQKGFSAGLFAGAIRSQARQGSSTISRVECFEKQAREWKSLFVWTRSAGTRLEPRTEAGMEGSSI